MAREIPRQGRSVLESAMTLPQATGHEKLANALGGLSNRIGEYSNRLKVEQATLEGAKQRLEGGPKKQLAPNLTPVTQAYNNAFINMDSALVYSAATEGMSLDMLEASTPASLAQGGAADRYMANAQARIRGAVDQALEQARPELALKLQQQAHNNMIRLMGMQQDYDYNQAKSNASVVIRQGTDQYAELMTRGYTDVAAEHLADLQNNMNAQLKLGYITPYEKYQYEEQLKQVGLNASAERVYVEKFKASEEAAARYIDELYNNPDMSITQGQREGMLQHLLGVHTRMTQAMTNASQIGYDNVMRFITPPDPEMPKFQSIDEVREQINNQVQQGHPINRHQQFLLENAFLAAQKKESKKANNNAEIVRLRDSPEIVRYKGKPLDDYWKDAFDFQRTQRNQLRETAQTPVEKIMADTPDWMIGASIAAQIKFAPISTYTNYLHTQLMNGSVQQQLEAVKAWSYLETNNPVSLQQFSARDQAFVHDVLDRMKDTRVAPEVIIKDATENILKVDERVYQNRLEALREDLKAKPKFVENLANEIFGGTISSTSSAPGSIMYSAVQREYEQNFLVSGNRQRAAKITKINMQNMAGVSKYGPGKQPIWNPPEKLPFANFGNILDNQYAQFINEVALSGQQHADVLGVNIKPSSKMPPVSNRLSDVEKITGQYLKGKGYLNINDKDVEVFLVSPSYNQANLEGGTRYQLYYYDNQIPRPVPMVSYQKMADGSTVPRVGNALMQFQGPQQYTPNALRQLQEEQADAGIMKAAEKAFNSVTPSSFFEIEPGSPFDMPTFVKRQKRSKENKEEFQEFLKSYTKSMPQQIEEEKLRRQVARAEEMG